MGLEGNRGRTFFFLVRSNGALSFLLWEAVTC